jgi:hypothetical protein
MDYLDPEKERRHRNLLYVGYILIAIAIALASRVLVYEAYGYGLNNQGTVIQNGLVFFSSQPHPAYMYLNGILSKSKTNSRVTLAEGAYKVVLTRSGYQNWQRTIEVNGGSVEHFDYPLLIPNSLTPSNVQSFSAAPTVSTQSPDHHWIVINQPDATNDFSVFDTTKPSEAATTITIPANIVSKATTSESWQFDQWADDNDHVLLTHMYDGKSEYILLDRQDPALSLNLNQTFAVTPSKLTLNNLKYDQYYIYTADNQLLQSASLKSTALQPIVSHVLAYQSYGSDTLLYATDSDQPSGKVAIELHSNNQTYLVHVFSTTANDTFLLDLTTYNGILYVAAGATSQNKVYIYKDPIGQLTSQPDQDTVPIQVLHVTSPNYVSFSNTAQFVMAENATEFSVYDIEYQNTYTYTTMASIDSPQAHASWMDGDRLTYVSGGKLFMFDYDNKNVHSLVPAEPQFLPDFSADYTTLYTLAPDNNTNGTALTETSLLSAADR